MNMTQHQEMLKTATTAVRDMEFLTKNDEFNRFLEHFKRRADALAGEILHNDMSDSEREKLRQFRLGILEVLRGPNEIYSTNFALLNRGS